MKNIISSIALFLSCLIAGFNAAGQANASINILTLNSGQVILNGTVYIRVDIGNTGPVSDIGMNKVRAQISIPIAIATAVISGQQDGIPAGWSILTNTGGTIQVCNGTDIIPVNAVRTVLIKVQGTAIGGPSTVTGVLSFGPGTAVCTGPGSLAGDITADNTSTSSIQVIPVPPCNLSVSGAAGTITCNGGNTTLTATPASANGAVEYSLTGGPPYQSSNMFTVTAGTYTITAREVNNPACTANSSPVIVSQPGVVTAPAINSIIQPNCTVATGTVELGGLPAGNWTLTRNPGNVITNGTGTTATINGLAPGTYTFIVTNSAGCISPTSADVIINPQSIPTAPSVNTIQPSCTLATGTITITSTTTGLTFSLDGGGFAAYPAGGYVVAAGAHTLVAQNAIGCLSTVTNITVDPQPPTPSAPITGTITQPTCAVSTGSVMLSGLPAGNWTINPGTVAGTGTTTTINNLAAGTYNFTVTNAAGCTSMGSADVIINDVPGAPPAPTVNVVQPTCTVATGTITITSVTTGLTFSLDGSAYAAYPAGGYIVAAGPHTLTAQNAGNCISAIANITVNAQPSTPAAPAVNISQPTCTIANGTITVTSTTAGLTFSFDGGGYAAYPTGGYTAAAGSHTLTARSAAGCVSAVTNAIVNVQPSSPTATLSTGTIACFGGTTTLTATGSGGVAPLQYSLNGGAFQAGNTFTVGTGTYSVTVRDANLCATTTAPLTVTQPSLLTATASVGIVSCNGGTTTIVVAAAGGTAPLQYSLNGGTFQPGNTFTTGAGTYTVTVKDVNLCTATTAPVTITQPAPIVVMATAKRITQCGGTTVVTVSASGGITPYQSPGTGTFVRGPGTWNFPVTDAAGCMGNTEITIEAPGCIDLKVYPNPANSSIIINHSTAEPGSRMQVFDIAGALVISQSVPADAFQTTIDVAKLAAGTYVAVYINGKEKKQTLFVKVNSN